MDMLGIARYGMRAAELRLEASARRVAAAPRDIDLVHETVEQIQALNAFKANASVARVADETWRALIDVQARPDRDL